MTDSRINQGQREPESSEEIKADIAQTRAQMESKISQIQYKLDPDRLKEQAQETMRGMVTDSSNAVMDYMRRHKEEISSSMLEAVKNNPIPTALIGLGLGWLALESMSPKRDRHEFNRRLPVRRADAVRYESGYDYESRYVGGGDWSDERWTEYGRTPTYGEWQGSSAPNRGRYASSEYEPYNGPYASQVSGSYAEQAQDGRNWRQEAKSQARGMVENVKDTAQNIGENIGEKAGEAVESVRDTMGQAGERVRSSTEHFTERARGQAGQFGHQMGDRGQELGMQARQMGRRLEHQVEDNPLMFGALAFAVGAAVAILMPRTRIENRTIGETRDRVMDSAQEMGQEMVERAQQVVEEVRPELEQTAKKVVEDVKQVGKEATHELKDTAQKAQEKAKEEGKEMTAQAQGKASQSTSQTSSQMAGIGKMPENWTTLKGRWHQIKGDIKSQWGKLTDDDLTKVEGDYEKLVGLIQQKYGYTRSQAEQEINSFSRSRVF